MQQRLQAIQAAAEQAPRALDRGYLTAQQAVVYLELGTVSALYWHIRENHLPYGRVGRRYRFLRTELDAWVSGFASSLEQQRALRFLRVK